MPKSKSEKLSEKFVESEKQPKEAQGGRRGGKKR